MGGRYHHHRHAGLSVFFTSNFLLDNIERFFCRPVSATVIFRDEWSLIRVSESPHILFAPYLKMTEVTS